MSIYLMNSAVMPCGCYGTYDYVPASLEEVRELLQSGNYVSRIGYPQTCQLLEKWTGIRPACNRSETYFCPGDEALVMRLKRRVADPATKGQPVSENPNDWEFARIVFDRWAPPVRRRVRKEGKS